jgi:hypothetical protein
MRVLLLGLIFLSPPRIKLLLLQWFCGARIGRRAHIGWVSAVMARHVELGEYSVVRPLLVCHSFRDCQSLDGSLLIAGAG